MVLISYLWELNNVNIHVNAFLDNQNFPVQRVYALLADEECRLSSDHWSNTNPSLLCHKQELCYRESQLPLFPHAEIVLQVILILIIQ